MIRRTPVGAADVGERLILKQAAHAHLRRGSAGRSDGDSRPKRPAMPSCQGKIDLNVLVGGGAVELLAVDDVVQRPRRVEQPKARRTRGRPVVAEDGSQRNDARTASDEEERAAECGLPDEVAADRPAELQLVTGAELVDEVGRHLTVVEPLHGEHEIAVFRPRGDRVAALSLVPVLGREAHIDVLAGAMPGPGRNLQHDASGPRRLVSEPTTLASCQLSRRSTVAPATDRRSCGSRTLPRTRARPPT